MSGLSVKVDLADAVREAQAAFEAFAVDRFPRALQFGLTGVAIEAVNLFRRDIPNIWHAPNPATRDALRYVVDKDLLGKVAAVGEAKAEVFVQDLPSVWLKYSFGQGPQRREGGDVGIEAYFGDQSTIKVPVTANLQRTGLAMPGANGKVSGRDAKRVARLAAAGYSRNTAGATKGSGSWGVFEIKPGDTTRQHGFYTGPGIYARPPRVVAAVGRKRVARAIKAGRRTAPTTSFTRASGRSVTVPKVVNNDRPRQLFLSSSQGEYEPVATPSWEDAMERAGKTLADRLAGELADRLDHRARKRR
ncbi:hypothetical protein [Methylorubrum extorquens]|uniref:Uncharacterized protein n=1 Tax=Methylorubrum extorquens (strain ATCC 14718 / DSM 1338 / JCM 2805 / NCIMB 9133 / AM1) TaxID=272630 RepID=C5B649_METEA|nr:hypothetical protein [Methylorubrum extorquens]ACS43931.1 Hypothetical protein MexAM1_META2p1163 [Methylorubrum extorquens AM1]MCP1546218.1 hypothetical protein [Methylorubrum extorquens]MCP1590885.1 hypothetical protein [Methylorubrum extorquens]